MSEEIKTTEIVTDVPSFKAEEQTDYLDEPRALSLVEKQVLQDRARGMDEAEARYSLRFIETAYLVEELARREQLARRIVGDIDGVMTTGGTETDDYIEKINAIHEIIREGERENVEGN